MKKYLWLLLFSSLAFGQLPDGMTANFNNGVQWETPNREFAIFSRWLSPDSTQGGQWNTYAYTTNPNSFSDPSGLYARSGTVCANDPSSCVPGSGVDTNEYYVASFGYSTTFDGLDVYGLVGNGNDFSGNFFQQAGGGGQGIPLNSQTLTGSNSDLNVNGSTTQTFTSGDIFNNPDTPVNFIYQPTQSLPFYPPPSGTPDFRQPSKGPNLKFSKPLCGDRKSTCLNSSHP
jgi:hypothetical protein